MGQKVNPVGFRIVMNHDWDCVWYNEADYRKNLIQDLKIQEYVAKNYSHCSISKVVTERAGNHLTVLIKTSRPGVLIGKKGADIEKIKKQVESMGEKDVAVKIFEVEKADLDARIVGQTIAKQLENRAAFKRVVKKAIQNTMKHGALGIKVTVSGRLGGVEIARSETYKEGTIPLHTLSANIDYALVEAHTTYGIIGVKVWIYKK